MGNPQRRAGSCLNAGVIREGALADAVFLDLENERLVPNFSLTSNWVYATDSRAIHSVLCDGKFVMKTVLSRTLKRRSPELAKVSNQSESLIRLLFCDCEAAACRLFMRCAILRDIVYRRRTMAILIRNAYVFAPKELGVTDVLMVGEKSSPSPQPLCQPTGLKHH